MSIDRRAFVQSALVAAGGAAGAASEATAQPNVQLAQAGSYTPPLPTSGPWKPYSPEGAGDRTQWHYRFLKKLFEKSDSFRDKIWNMDDKAFRKMLEDELSLTIGANIPILIVDIGKGRTRISASPTLGAQCSVTGCTVGDPTKTLWYTLVLPPLPLEYQYADGRPEHGYLHEMTWEAAWHHAIVYGYGM